MFTKIKDRRMPSIAAAAAAACYMYDVSAAKHAGWSVGWVAHGDGLPYIADDDADSSIRSRLLARARVCVCV